MEKDERVGDIDISKERERITDEYRRLAFGDGEAELKCSEKLKALAEYSRVLDDSESRGDSGGVSLIVIYNYE